MACCGARPTSDNGRRYFPLELLRLVLEGVLSGLAIAVVYAASPLSRKIARKSREFALALLRSWRESAREVLDTPFLFDSSLRCRVSGRLYARSEALAGAAYRYFNLGVFVVTATAVSSLAIFLASMTS